MKRIGSALVGFLVGIVFGVVRAWLSTPGGHGFSLSDAVLAGAPFSVFQPHKTWILGTLLFWGLLGLVWRSVRFRRYLVLCHVVAVVFAFALVPEYRDWYWIQWDDPSTYGHHSHVATFFHVAVLLGAVFYEGPKRKVPKWDQGEKRWEQRWD